MECEGRARHQSREQRVNDYVIKPLPWTLLEIPTARGKNMREITTLGILIFHRIKSIALCVLAGREKHRFNN